MRPFFDQHSTRWRSLTGALHLYACPQSDDPLLRTYRKEADALSSFDGLKVQPERYVHMTLQRLDAYREQIDPERLSQLTACLAQELPTLSPFVVSFAGASARPHAVEAVGEPSDPWVELVESIRGAVERAGLGSTLTESPYGPHYTVAYCVADTADSSIEAALAPVAARTTMKIDRVSLVAVDQLPDQGIFTFDTMAEWPLGDTAPPRVKAGDPWSAGPA